MERTAILEKSMSLPREALRWAAVCSLYFIFAYWGCNWLASHRTGLGTVHFEWEKRIPLIPEMIIPYMSIDLFFAGSFFLCRGSRELAAHSKRLLLAMTIGGICFLLFPLELGFERQWVDHSLGWIFQALWFFDYPHNLAPSLHVAQLAILWPVYVRSTRGGLRFFVTRLFSTTETPSSCLSAYRSSMRRPPERLRSYIENPHIPVVGVESIPLLAGDLLQDLELFRMMDNRNQTRLISARQDGAG
ncbi:MAG: hypothetical protein HY717_07530 [Planctomycetes bacterium]|nr:hypothetical protein [Planctomycetota bacterium]